MSPTLNLMEKFIRDRKNLDAYSKVKYNSVAPRPYLFIEHPEILAGFAGYLKSQSLKNNASTKVYCRGQINDYASIPSLLRAENMDDSLLERRLVAYETLVNKTKELYTAKRFQQENINPIFQHYGLKTPWLDLVDNVFVALWFATHKYFGEENGKKAHYKTSKKESGHIYFYATSPQTNYYDLREGHSSLSLRLHAQHGISMTRNTQWSVQNRSLDDHLVATVKFPNTEEWRPSGLIFSSKFLFPSADLDNTYKYLKMEKFNELLNKITDDHRLEKGELGSIADFW